MPEVVTAEYIRSVLDYDPDTGVFTWRRPVGPRAKPGQKTGVVDKSSGYVRIRLLRQTRHAHRLAWLYVHGGFPGGVIDHINGDRADNRIANLRDATPTMNMQNQRKSRGRSGYLGVWYPSGRATKFTACIVMPSGRKVLGQFDTAEAAHEVYLTAKRKFHEGCSI
jgi:hypothetical protein